MLLGAGSLAAFESTPPQGATGAQRLRVLRRAEFDDDLMTIYSFGER